MHLHRSWRAILTRAWSIRLMVLAAAFSGMEVALPFLHGILPVGAGTFALLSGLTTAAAFVARIVAQKGLSE
jgi:hypothetical protein